MAQTDTKKLKAYFDKLAMPQKKEFIQNLKVKISDVKDSKYRGLLQQCISDYNNAVQKAKAAPKEDPDTSLQDALFAKALSSMLTEKKASCGTVMDRLVGRWQRHEMGQTMYIQFNDDGSFETNENGRVVSGRYSLGLDGVLLMEPGDLFSSEKVLMSQKSLFIWLANGDSLEYSRYTT